VGEGFVGGRPRGGLQSAALDARLAALPVKAGATKPFSLWEKVAEGRMRVTQRWAGYKRDACRGVVKRRGCDVVLPLVER
jgi:hypothetical protein